MKKHTDKHVSGRKYLRKSARGLKYEYTSKFKTLNDMNLVLKIWRRLYRPNYVLFSLKRRNIYEYQQYLKNGDLRRLFKKFKKLTYEKLTFKIYINDEYIMDFCEKNTLSIFFYLHKFYYYSGTSEIYHNISSKLNFDVITMYPEPNDEIKNKAKEMYKRKFQNNDNIKE